MKRYIIIAVLMALVTYIPRVVPTVMLNNKKLSPFFKSFLQFIPFAALASLVFPQVFYSTDSISSAIIGVIVSITLAFFRLNVITVVFGGIIGVFLCSLL